MRKLRLAAILWVLSAGAWGAAAEPPIVPRPASVVVQRGAFELREGTPVCAGDNATALEVTAYLVELVRRTDHVALDARRRSAIDLVRRTDHVALDARRRRGCDGAIELDVDAALGPEAYRLASDRHGVRIVGGDRAGLLYGAVSLWQALDRTRAPRLALPALAISDAPRFAWRGLMLDSARQFQSVDFIRNYLDWMALHKLNVLHWHLTDDQGWRLEIRKYPRLTAVGAWRVPAGPAAAGDIDPATGHPRVVGGFYTQDEVRALVAYAAARGITIVPEIETPGHGSAAFAAYPRLAAGFAPAGVPADWGVYPDVYSVDDETLAFLEDVLTEVMALFPSRAIHVGGDEVQGLQWAQTRAGRERMRALGVADPKELQHDFTRRLGAFLAAHGRRLVGWDEILSPGMSSDAIVMSWQGTKGAVAAAARGNDTVLAPWPTLYFDNRQGSGPGEPPGRTHVIALEEVYRFEPVPAELAADQAAHVLGLEATVWTEHIRTEPRVGWMSFPRAAALAELGWTKPARRDWDDFLRRLPALFARYEALGVPHADSVFAVQAERRFDLARGRAALTLSTQAGKGATIRYALDGAEPTPKSREYRAPLDLPLPSVVRAATFVGPQRVSATRVLDLSREHAQQRTSRELALCSDGIGLALEDDAPVAGERAVFDVDIMNPCWWFKDADLDHARSIEAAVGQAPFNFQIGDEIRKIRFATPQTPAGELEVHIDACDGALLARLPLEPATRSQAVTVLPRAPLASASGRHDLCLRFAQETLAPLYVLDRVRLIDEVQE